MRLSQISLGNLRRRKGKTVLLAAGLTVGVAMVVAMISITSRMKADVERKLDEYGANIVVTPKSESVSLNYGGINVTDASLKVQELRETDALLIKGIENNRNITAVAPMLIGVKTVGGRSLLIIGVDFPSQFKIKKWWRLKGMKSHAGIHPSLIGSKKDVILGSAAAKALDMSQGSVLGLSGKDFSVKGVLDENGSQDDIAVFINLDEAQELLGKKGAVSMIEVGALCSECPIEDIVAQITARLPHAKVTAVRQAMTIRMQTVGQLTRFSIAVSAVVIVIGSLVVFVSMMSSVSERTKEIGVLRAIGFRKSHIVKVILTEAFVVSLISALSGWVLGTLAAMAISSESGYPFDPVMLAVAVALAFSVGISSSIFPAIKASRLEPIEALRYG